MLPNLSNIKLKRRMLGLSQKELSILVGVNQGTIAKIENKKIVPNYNIAKRIFEALENIEKKEEKHAGEIMIKPVVYIHPNDTLKRAAMLMSKHGFSNLPVVENRIVVGSLREKTLLEAGEKNYNKICSKFMEIVPTQISEKTSLSVVREILKHEACLVVVGKNGKIKGMISRSDLL